MKKFLIIILILGLAGGGYYFYSNQSGGGNESLYNLSGEELIESTEATLVGTIPYVHRNDPGLSFSYEDLNSLFTTTNAKFLWIEEVENLEGTHEVYSVSEQDFMNNVIEHHKKYSSPKEETPIYSNAETLRNLAETLVDNLTTLNGSTSTGLLSSYYLSSFNPVVWDCLNGASVNTDFPKDFFEANNFNLIITDPVASTIISGSKALSKNPIYGVLVNAKVQTSFNSGAFGELDWVPEKGMTNSVDFLIFFTNSSWKGAGKCAYITNVTIVNYESIEN